MLSWFWLVEVSWQSFQLLERFCAQNNSIKRGTKEQYAQSDLNEVINDSNRQPGCSIATRKWQIIQNYCLNIILQSAFQDDGSALNTHSPCTSGYVQLNFIYNWLILLEAASVIVKSSSSELSIIVTAQLQIKSFQLGFESIK